MLNALDVFISYARADNPLADALAAFLRASDLQVWLDVDRLRPPENITEAVGAGAKAASTCVAILSKAYVKSAWCKQELTFFKMQGTRIIGYMAQTDTPLPPVLSDSLCARTPSELLGALLHLPKTELREETLSRAGMHTAFRIPHENERRDDRTRSLIEEELQAGDGKPQLRLLASSGFTYVHPESAIRTQLGITKLIERGCFTVVLQSPFSDFAVTRALTSNIVTHHWEDKVDWQHLMTLTTEGNINIYVTDLPINCSLLFTRQAVLFDPYLWGIEPFTSRPENRFWVFEFRQRDDRYACYDRLMLHFEFLLAHSQPFAEFIGTEPSYQARTMEFQERLRRMRAHSGQQDIRCPTSPQLGRLSPRTSPPRPQPGRPMLTRRPTRSAKRRP